MALCEADLSDGSDLVAEEIKSGLGWNSQSHTKFNKTLCTHRPHVATNYAIHFSANALAIIIKTSLNCSCFSIVVNWLILKIFTFCINLRARPIFALSIIIFFDWKLTWSICKHFCNIFLIGDKVNIPQRPLQLYFFNVGPPKESILLTTI